MAQVAPNPQRQGSRRWPAVVSVLGVLALSFVAGTATMYFHGPSSDFFRRAFAGAQAWWHNADGRADASPADRTRPQVTIDQPESTCDGFTLITTNQAPQAELVDMSGRIVHRWSVQDEPGNGRSHWERCRIFPNGDLLALCCRDGAIPYGHRLVKIDKDSRVLWQFRDNVHHDFDIAEDGRILALAGKAEDDGAEAAPVFADALLILSPDGRELQRVSILKAFRNSPYALLLPRFTPPHPSVPPDYTGPDSTAPRDVLHANSVEALRRAHAAKFALFRPGQVLLSLRSPSALAVLDVDKTSIVWAAKGAWHAQHDAHFLDTGRLLMFDNLGGASGARVLEYDPVSQAVDWSWGGDKDARFDSDIRGGVQRLANGNTLVLDSVGRNVFEVTAAKETVWQWSCPAPTGSEGRPAFNVTGARRYVAQELPFLDGVPRPRTR